MSKPEQIAQFAARLSESWSTPQKHGWTSHRTDRTTRPE